MGGQANAKSCSVLPHSKKPNRHVRTTEIKNPLLTVASYHAQTMRGQRPMENPSYSNGGLFAPLQNALQFFVQSVVHTVKSQTSVEALDQVHPVHVSGSVCFCLRNIKVTLQTARSDQMRLVANHATLVHTPAAWIFLGKLSRTSAKRSWA